MCPHFITSQFNLKYEETGQGNQTDSTQKKKLLKKLSLIRVKTAQYMILLAHADQLTDYDKCITLYTLSRSKQFDLPYYSNERSDLVSCSEGECKTEFRFDKWDIYRLCNVFEIPEEIRCYNGMVSGKQEALCISLKIFTYPYRYEDLMLKSQIKDSAPGMNDIKSSIKYYLRKLRIFTEKYNSKLIGQE